MSIDTEEDNWVPTRHGIQLENIRRLPALQSEFDRIGLRATYFTTWQVLRQPWAAEIIRSLDGRAEIGGHLHPWNTPPVDEPLTPPNTMLKNLPADLQLAKMTSLTSALTGVLGHAPVSFRAGRFGIGPGTIEALVANGYRVDSSVMPYVSWEGLDDGPDFIGAPLNAYRVAPGHSVIEPVAGGPIIEVPLSCAYSRRPFDRWGRMQQLFSRAPLRRLHAAGVAVRFGMGRRILISPETTSLKDMLLVAYELVRDGTQHLQLFFHSPSLMHGLTPFVETASQARAIVPTIQRFFDGLQRFATPVCLTIGEAAEMLAGSGDTVTAPAKPAAHAPVRISLPVHIESVFEPGGNWAWMVHGRRARALCVGDVNGSQLASLSRRFDSVLSVDRRPAHSAAVGDTLERQGVRGVSFVQGWLPALPVEDAAFDCVALPGLFDHWPAATSAREGLSVLREGLLDARRVLRPGGTLFLSLHNRERDLVFAFDLVQTLMRSLRGAGTTTEAFQESWRPMPRTLERAVRAAGFTDVRLAYAEPSHFDLLRVIPRTRHASMAFERFRAEGGGGGVRHALARVGLHGLLYGSLICFARS